MCKLHTPASGKASSLLAPAGRPRRGAALVLCAVAAATLAACAGTADRERPASDPYCKPPAITREGWRHSVTGGAFASSLGNPHHAANDVIAAVGEPVRIHGKFAYGGASKDLEDEQVVLYLAPEGSCAGREVARAITNDDGRATFALPALPAGIHRFWLGVPGDGSMAAGAVHVITPGRKAVLFDIDGTLTANDGELIEDLAGGGPPDMMTDAPKVARHWAARGYQVLYVSGRVYFLRASTLAWLAARGFPAGPVITTESLGEAMPTTGGVGEFKTRILTGLKKKGLEIIRAYGNADTDVCAYARAGIDPAQSFMVGPPGRACAGYPATRALNSYTDHLRELGSEAVP
jgi:hypothetical protein